MYEELLMSEEGLQETANSRIHIGNPIEYDEKIFMEQLVELQRMAENDSKEIRQYVKNIVDTYKVLDREPKKEI